MQSYLSIFLFIDALDNINLAISWPVGAGCPKGRPDTTSISRHMSNVCNEKALVELDVGRDTG